ncbi:MAG: M20/M25/M40 family metallo-hydrolase [Flavobacteriales bacterium]|nr:M20/M25/M40 family metallo-hydrolase [Flavobacteriales bacterium]MCB9166365.1 M20/M25/M40 family metallo-hydrolase [Flavobacteriales bacterium]
MRAQAPTNIQCTDPLVVDVLKGQYDPADYAAAAPITDHQEIICAIQGAVDTDSLLADLRRLDAFHTRHTFSDTVSDAEGIGAARRWAYARFQQIGAANDGRFLPAYLQFDINGYDCSDIVGAREVMGVLPGRDASDPSVVIIEAHLDSRCAGPCDSACYAPGIDDNGSGSALVLELARVMAAYTFDRTILFLLTVGEEQGLIGAEAMAQFCEDQGVAVRGVLNNDIVGGIICGATSSPPSCPSEGDIDSLTVRIFSNPTVYYPHRALARTVKLFYLEKLQDIVPVPMSVLVMPQEDRNGRGGDHIPFRAHGFPSVRFTSANEAGDADVEDPDYHDRQHTSGDVLGVDTDGDQVIDSLFVDLDYLGRNAVINGASATLLASGPATPGFVLHDEPTGLRVSIAVVPGAMAYRVGVRNSGSGTDLDALYRTTDTSFVVPGLDPNHTYFISVASVDSAGITSPFSPDQFKSNDLATAPAVMDDLPFGTACGVNFMVGHPTDRPIPVLRASPDPYSVSTIILVDLRRKAVTGPAEVRILDLQGRMIDSHFLELTEGKGTLRLPACGASGLRHAVLLVGGVPIANTVLVQTP